MEIIYCAMLCLCKCCCCPFCTVIGGWASTSHSFNPMAHIGCNKPSAAINNNELEQFEPLHGLVV